MPGREHGMVHRGNITKAQRALPEALFALPAEQYARNFMPPQQPQLLCGPADARLVVVLPDNGINKGLPGNNARVIQKLAEQKRPAGDVARKKMSRSIPPGTVRLTGLSPVHWRRLQAMLPSVKEGFELFIGAPDLPELVMKLIGQQAQDTGAIGVGFKSAPPVGLFQAGGLNIVEKIRGGRHLGAEDNSAC